MSGLSAERGEEKEGAVVVSMTVCTALRSYLPYTLKDFAHGFAVSTASAVRDTCISDRVGTSLRMIEFVLPSMMQTWSFRGVGKEGLLL